MDRREQIAHLAATREEEMLLVRVCEKLDTAVQRDIPAATNFLSKREQMLVCEVLRGAPIRFFGGLSTAEREISCYLPDYLDEDWLTGEDGPVAAVRAAFFERDSLSHRDFLGALMGCGIKRETVGDIYVATGRCDFLVTRDILPYVLQYQEHTVPLFFLVGDADDKSAFLLYPANLLSSQSSLSAHEASLQH